MLDRFPTRWTTRAQVCAALSALLDHPDLPPPTLPKADDDRVRRRAALLFVRLARTREAPRLLELAARDPLAEVRSASLEALARLRPALTAPELERLLAPPSGASAREQVARLALGVVLSASPEARASARRAIASASPEVRGWLLGRLLGALHRRREPHLREAVEALRDDWLQGNAGPPAQVAAILTGLRRVGDPPGPRHAARWLRAYEAADRRGRARLLGGASGCPTLLEAVRASPERTRLAAEEVRLPLEDLLAIAGEAGLWARLVECVEGADRRFARGEPEGREVLLGQRLLHRWPAVVSRALPLIESPARHPRTRRAFAPALLQADRAAVQAAALRWAREHPDLFGAVLEHCAAFALEEDLPLLRAGLESAELAWQLAALRGVSSLARRALARGARPEALVQRQGPTDTSLPRSYEAVSSTSVPTFTRSASWLSNY